MRQKVEPIPKEVLNKAHRKLLKKLAVLIIQCMEEADISFETIETRLGWPEGRAQEELMLMISGESNLLREVSDLAVAMDCEIDIKALPIQKVLR